MGLNLIQRAPEVDPEAERRARRQAIAAELDCYTGADLEALYDFSAESMKDKRNKNSGPPFIVLGRTVLYPRELLWQYIRQNIGLKSSKARQRARASEVAEPLKAFAGGLAGKGAQP